MQLIRFFSLFIICSYLTNERSLAQPRFELIGNSASITQVKNEKGDISGIYTAPLVQFQLNKKWYSMLQLPPQLIIETKNLPSGKTYYHKEIIFRNVSRDTLLLENVIPLGAEHADAVISGEGDHALSRSYIFLPGRAPVNCILPDNAWELGFSAKKVFNDEGICGLTRRKRQSAVLTQISRFDNRIAPGGSVTYLLYIEAYKGKWQDALDTVFHKRYLYDVEQFDNNMYVRKDLQWMRHSYVMHLLMAWDNRYYDPATGRFTLTDNLRRWKQLYGGDDVVAIWPTWPTLGIDQRNQFDLYRDLPGGLPRLKQLVNECHKAGTKVFLAYNPWDESTRSEGHLNGLAEILKATNADGAVLDTRGESSKELQAAADGVRPGIIMYSEGMAVPKNMPGIVSGRVHNALYYPPLLNLNKVIKPEFTIYRVAELFKEPIRREFNTSFFNGYGTEINVFAPGNPDYEEEMYRYLGSTTMLLRQHTVNFTAGQLTPLIPTLSDSVYVNRWIRPEKTIYTIYNIKPQGFSGKLFEVDSTVNRHFIDLWNHLEVAPQKKGNKYYLPVTIDNYPPQWQGSNNEGTVNCIASFPLLLRSTLSGDSLEINGKGDSILVWAGAPAYGKSYLKLKDGKNRIRLLEKFPGYEGKFVIQLFEADQLTDENIIVIPAGTPRKFSSVQKTSAKGNQADMVAIPAGEFTFRTTNGDEFIPYPKVDQGRKYKMPAILMDKYPVTNTQYAAFIRASGYRPQDTSRYLHHWRGGKPVPGQENFPVVYISYEDARAYAAWAGKRLPAETEWQYAAQTSDSREWPWAARSAGIHREEEPVTGTLTVYRIKGIDSTLTNTGNGKPYAVGQYPKGSNPWGLQDISGNVWQLTNDMYQVGAYRYIIMKGGSYFNPSSSWWYVQGGPRELHYRQALLRVSQGFERNSTVGFRCMRDK